jgi:hypothetical protein
VGVTFPGIGKPETLEQLWVRSNFGEVKRGFCL